MIHSCSHSVPAFLSSDPSLKWPKLVNSYLWLNDFEIPSMMAIRYTGKRPQTVWGGGKSMCQIQATAAIWNSNK